jgi:hypothetical protein
MKKGSADMFKKLSTLVMAGVIFVSLLGFTGGSVALAATAGKEPESALAPAGKWMPLAVGQETWYAFNYAGDGSQILARMGVDPAGSATFSVWTPANVQQRAQGGTVTPVGQGATNDLFGGDLVWTGNFDLPGTYYVVVDQAGSTPGNYALTVSGSGVSFPQPKQVKAPAGGAKPMAPTGNSTPVAVGQQHWYTFDYAGDNSEILARMSVDPTGSAEFSVWTPALFQQLGQAGPGDKVDPVGRGSVDDGLGGDLVWQGNFNTPGTYHILVDQTGSIPSSYSLNVTGDGVTIPTPAKLAAIAAKSTTAAKSVATTEETKEPAATKIAETAKTAKVAAPVTPAKTAATAEETKESAATKTAEAAKTAKVTAPATPAKMGAGPGDALPLAGAWLPLTLGQETWYAFQYPGDGSEVAIQMSVDPTGSAGFKVFTPAQEQQWAQGSTVDPVGRGSANDARGGDLFWTGNFSTPGTYYVVVDQNGSVPSNYAIRMN